MRKNNTREREKADRHREKANSSTTMTGRSPITETWPRGARQKELVSTNSRGTSQATGDVPSHARVARESQPAARPRSTGEAVEERSLVAGALPISPEDSWPPFNGFGAGQVEQQQAPSPRETIVVFRGHRLPTLTGHEGVLRRYKVAEGQQSATRGWDDRDAGANRIACPSPTRRVNALQGHKGQIGEPGRPAAGTGKWLHSGEASGKRFATERPSSWASRRLPTN
ncbi:hypothetical protein GQ53DRAFT_813545 [Thozetella sp. PMI_491]|nr:hypothetical protein GQ53DRAFT_813545 [Thozetella sp. PMI_491]